MGPTTSTPTVVKARGLEMGGGRDVKDEREEAELNTRAALETPGCVFCERHLIQGDVQLRKIRAQNLVKMQELP